MSRSGSLRCFTRRFPDTIGYSARAFVWKGRGVAWVRIERGNIVATRGLGLADLQPSRVQVVRLGEAALAEARALNRARLAARYWHALES